MPPKKKVCIEDSKNMLWTDDEVKLLLETVFSFKNKKSYEGIDWELENKPGFHGKLLLREKRLQQKKQMRVSYSVAFWQTKWGCSSCSNVFRLVQPDKVWITSH